MATLMCNVRLVTGFKSFICSTVRRFSGIAVIFDKIHLKHELRPVLLPISSEVKYQNIVCNNSVFLTIEKCVLFYPES